MNKFFIEIFESHSRSIDNELTENATFKDKNLNVFLRKKSFAIIFHPKKIIILFYLQFLRGIEKELSKNMIL